MFKIKEIFKNSLREKNIILLIWTVHFFDDYLIRIAIPSSGFGSTGLEFVP